MKNRFTTTVGNQNVEIKYAGIPVNDVDEQEVKTALELFCSDNTIDYKDIIQNITYLRTILKDYKESFLYYEYLGSIYNEKVVYDNGILIYYSKKFIDTEFGYDVIYKNECFDISLQNVHEKFIALIDINKTIFEYVNKLKCIRKIELDMDDKKLLEAYKIFFGYEPSFDYRFIEEQFQCMTYLLQSNGVELNKYNFILDDTNKYPFSIRISELVKIYKSIGNIQNIKRNLSLSDMELIKNIGDIYIDNKDDIKDLISITKNTYIENNICKEKTLKKV